MTDHSPSPVLTLTCAAPGCEAVNWRGNGCPRCARKNAPRRTDRPADEL